jgi:ribosomal protein L40E
MAKFPEAEARKFRNMFVCRRCKAKIKAPTLSVLAGKIKCRNCDGKVLRPIKKK